MAESTGKKPRVGLMVLLLVIAMVATGAVMALWQNIQTRKYEARSVVFKVVDLDETTVDPAVWGKNFPHQYDAYLRTAESGKTTYGGSEAMPASKLEHDPRLKTIFAGYAFAIDYRERRGHAYMLYDQRETERVKQKPQPGACLQCHASNTVAYREAGLKLGAPGAITDPVQSDDGMAQLFKGWESINPMPYLEATKLVSHPVGCIDCHDPRNLQLRVTRPGFINGIRALAKSDAPVPHLPSIEKWRKGDRKKEYDPNIDASRQEMRSMACGQCHVEYYFKGEEKKLTYPWYNGLKVEQIEKYYDDEKFKDWTHAISGAPILKAQHPEFETWSQGVHARAGVACADCHMPYQREGAVKVSDHQVRSPLFNISSSCQTCHRVSEEELRDRVKSIQDRTAALLARAEIANVSLIDAIKGAMDAGASDDQLKSPRDFQRKGQWRTDFVNAENSMGFHAPAETARILGEAIDYCRQGEVEVAKLRLPAAAPAKDEKAAAAPPAPTDAPGGSAADKH
jgi:nitrite reductase (cytochrome c-552)